MDPITKLYLESVLNLETAKVVDDTGIYTAAVVEDTPGEAAALAVENQPQQVAMSTKAKVLSLPPGTSPRFYPLQVNGVYRIVDRNPAAVTVVGDDGRKVTISNHLVQLLA